LNYPAISIITPSFNQGQFLEETFLSIINQNYPALELIVIDGGSTDNSVEIIRKYERHIKYWVSEKDNGQSEAINKGLKIATGDIINWINSDDILMPNALHAIGNIFSQLPEETGLIHGGTIAFNNDADLYTDFGYDEVNTERYLAGIAFPQPSAFFLRKLLLDVGYLNEDLHFKMDYDLYSRMVLKTNFLKVTNVFSKYRLHESSKTVSQSNKFVEDLHSIFLTRVNELGLEWINTQLHAVGIANSGWKSKQQLNHKTIDQKKLIFYFFCYISKLDYTSGNFYRSRKLIKYLRTNYTKEELFNEKEMQLIYSRLKLFPDFIINLIRKIK
jgi:glycosyltransferase involved in cell wall biosynthesis